MEEAELQNHPPAEVMTILVVVLNLVNAMCEAYGITAHSPIAIESRQVEPLKNA